MKRFLMLTAAAALSLPQLFAADLYWNTETDGVNFNTTNWRILSGESWTIGKSITTTDNVFFDAQHVTTNGGTLEDDADKDINVTANANVTVGNLTILNDANLNIVSNNTTIRTITLANATLDDNTSLTLDKVSLSVSDITLGTGATMTLLNNSGLKITGAADFSAGTLNFDGGTRSKIIELTAANSSIKIGAGTFQNYTVAGATDGWGLINSNKQGTKIEVSNATFTDNSTRIGVLFQGVDNGTIIVTDSTFTNNNPNATVNKDYAVVQAANNSVLQVLATAGHKTEFSGNGFTYDITSAGNLTLSAETGGEIIIEKGIYANNAVSSTIGAGGEGTVTLLEGSVASFRNLALTSGTLDAKGTLNIVNGAATISDGATLKSSGTIKLDQYGLTNNGIIQNSGDWNLNSQQVKNNSTGNISLSAGTVTLSAITGSLSTSKIFQNSGKISVTGGDGGVVFKLVNANSVRHIMQATEGTIWTFDIVKNSGAGTITGWDTLKDANFLIAESFDGDAHTYDESNIRSSVAVKNGSVTALKENEDGNTTLYWNGNTNNEWSLTGSSWRYGEDTGAATGFAFKNGDVVIFDSKRFNQGSNTAISRPTTTATLVGDLSAAQVLIKTGTSVTLTGSTGSLTTTGATSIENGAALKIDSTTWTANGDVALNGTLNFSGTGAFAGTGAMTVADGAKVTFAADGNGGIAAQQTNTGTIFLKSGGVVENVNISLADQRLDFAAGGKINGLIISNGRLIRSGAGAHEITGTSKISGGIIDIGILNYVERLGDHTYVPTQNDIKNIAAFDISNGNLTVSSGITINLTMAGGTVIAGLSDVNINTSSYVIFYDGTTNGTGGKITGWTADNIKLDHLFLNGVKLSTYEKVVLDDKTYEKKGWLVFGETEVAQLVWTGKADNDGDLGGGTWTPAENITLAGGTNFGDWTSALMTHLEYNYGDKNLEGGNNVDVVFNTAVIGEDFTVTLGGDVAPDKIIVTAAGNEAHEATIHSVAGTGFKIHDADASNKTSVDIRENGILVLDGYHTYTGETHLNANAAKLKIITSDAGGDSSGKYLVNSQITGEGMLEVETQNNTSFENVFAGGIANEAKISVFTKSGDGTLTINDAHSQILETKIDAGTIKLANTKGLGDGKITVSSGAELNVALTTAGTVDNRIVVDVSGTLSDSSGATGVAQSKLSGAINVTIGGKFVATTADSSSSIFADNAVVKFGGAEATKLEIIAASESGVSVGHGLTITTTNTGVSFSNAVVTTENRDDAIFKVTTNSDRVVLSSTVDISGIINTDESQGFRQSIIDNMTGTNPVKGFALTSDIATNYAASWFDEVNQNSVWTDKIGDATFIGAFADSININGIYCFVAYYSDGYIYFAVPEPSFFGIFAGLGALALCGTRRRRRK